ncbi:hypothetical protein HRbin15_01504 [bacterium HR15]|nr:hypothetical protein HRbin15_01504 [bacterium HR15]
MRAARWKRFVSWIGTLVVCIICCGYPKSALSFDHRVMECLNTCLRSKIRVPEDRYWVVCSDRVYFVHKNSLQDTIWDFLDRTLKDAVGKRKVKYLYNSDGVRVWKGDYLSQQEYRYVCRIGCGGVPMRVSSRVFGIGLLSLCWIRAGSCRVGIQRLGLTRNMCVKLYISRLPLRA